MAAIEEMATKDLERSPAHDKILISAARSISSVTICEKIMLQECEFVQFPTVRTYVGSLL